MTGMGKAAIALGVGMAALLGVGVAVAHSGSSSPSGGGAPPPPAPPVPTPNVPPIATCQWVRVDNNTGEIQPNDHVRLSYVPSDVQKVVATMAVVVQQQVSAILNQLDKTAAGAMTSYAPGQALPSDWPSDDDNAAQEFHVDFVVGPSMSPVLLATIPLPIKFWVQQCS